MEAAVSGVERTIKRFPETIADPPDRAVVILPVPNGFAYEAELIEVCELVIAQLKSGMPKRECLRRLWGWTPGEGA